MWPTTTVADKDYALGRIVEFLSHTPWWREVAIFFTEHDAQGGRDHIDAHRNGVHGDRSVFQSQLRVARKHQLSARKLKTIFRLLGIAAAEPVRRSGQRLERLLHQHAGLRGLSGAAGGSPDFRSGADDPAEVVR